MLAVCAKLCAIRSSSGSSLGISSPLSLGEQRAIAAGLLGPVHGGVGGVHELLGIAAAAREHAAAGDRDRQGSAARREALVAHRQADALCDQPERIMRPHARHEHRELLATPAPDRRVLRQSRPHARDDRDQHVVARLVPMGVVRALEVVDIEQEQAERLRFGRQDGVLERVLEAPAVREPRQRVGVRGTLGRDARLLELAVCDPRAAERRGHAVLRQLARRDVGDDALGDHAARFAPAAPAVDQPARAPLVVADAVLDASREAGVLRRSHIGGDPRAVVGVDRLQPPVFDLVVVDWLDAEKCRHRH